MKFCITICFFVTTLCYTQNEALFEIINSDTNLELRQHKIDSLIAVNQQKLPPIQLADFYHDLASRWFFNNWWNNHHQMDMEKTIFYTDQALKLKMEQDGLEEGSLEKTLYNLGYYKSLNGDVYEAINLYISLVKKGNGDIVQEANFELGIFYVSIGDFFKALERFDEFILFYRAKNSLDTDDSLFLVNGYLSKAKTYAQMGYKEFSEEIQTHLILADSILKEIGNFDNISFNIINHEEGNRLLRTGNYAKAINSFREVLGDSISLNARDIAVVYNSLALSQLKLKDHKKALSNLNKAISFDLNYTDPYENLGDLYLAQNEFKKGLFHYQKAIVYATDKSKVINYDDLPKIIDLELAIEKNKLLNHIVTKANGWIKYYKYDNNKKHLVHALETFTLADQLVDLIRFESTEHQSKLFWREQGASLYMKAVEVCYLLNRPQEAFHFMERNKALLLLEDLTNEEAKELAHLPQAIIQQEFKLKRNIFLEENELYETGHEGKESSDSLKSIIKESKYRYEEFIDSLNQAYPDYAKFKKKADILTFNELQSNYISDEQVVLHYILNEEDGYGLLTRTEGPILFQLKDGAQLNDQIDSLTSLLTSGISDITTLNTISNTLFNNLIPAEIYNKIKGKQLIIVPDYTLQRVPFETLVVDKTNTKYLIEDAQIAYVYSMSLLHHNKGIARNHSKELLSLAPIHFDKLGLVELRNSEHEVKGITPFFQGEVFLDEQASKANFLKEVAAPKIIHLATHADIGNGENPWIAFSDEKMYLKEIYATKNQSEMVVLSACNTLSGDLKRGEGVMSLARGFFYSGAKSVVSSLWPLTDESGSDIMISFYKNLDKGYSKSKALRQAKLEYMNSNIVEELKHPFYWAGFIVVGDNAPLVATQHSIWIYIGIVFVIGYLFRRKFLKRLQ